MTPIAPLWGRCFIVHHHDIHLCGEQRDEEARAAALHRQTDPHPQLGRFHGRIWASGIGSVASAKREDPGVSHQSITFLGSHHWIHPLFSTFLSHGLTWRHPNCTLPRCPRVREPASGDLGLWHWSHSMMILNCHQPFLPSSTIVGCWWLLIIPLWSSLTQLKQNNSSRKL